METQETMIRQTNLLYTTIAKVDGEPQLVYTFHADPGHGWLEVQVGELRRLGILKDISHYSYRQGHTAYLEEDCDADRFVQAKAKAGEAFRSHEVYEENTPIRNMDHYHV